MKGAENTSVLVYVLGCVWGMCGVCVGCLWCVCVGRVLGVWALWWWCVWGGVWGRVCVGRGSKYRSPLYLPDTLVNPDTCLGHYEHILEITLINE